MFLMMMPLSGVIAGLLFSVEVGLIVTAGIAVFSAGALGVRHLIWLERSLPAYLFGTAFGVALNCALYALPMLATHWLRGSFEPAIMP